jgi:hypothetical protein
VAAVCTFGQRQRSDPGRLGVRHRSLMLALRAVLARW